MPSTSDQYIQKRQADILSVLQPEDADIIRTWVQTERELTRESIERYNQFWIIQVVVIGIILVVVSGTIGFTYGRPYWYYQTNSDKAWHAYAIQQEALVKENEDHANQLFKRTQLCEKKVEVYEAELLK